MFFPSLHECATVTQRTALLRGSACWYAVLCGLCLCGGRTANLPAGEEAPRATLQSGRAIGERVPQFYVRAVTGPLMNRSVCYVCRNGDRPVVMVFLREVVPGTAELLKEIDRCVDAHRADGLKGFCVLLSEDSRAATSRLQTLAFDNTLALPLTWTSSQIETGANQNLHAEAAVTVVLYRDQHVVSATAWRKDELTRPAINKVLADMQQLLGVQP